MIDLITRTYCLSARAVQLLRRSFCLSEHIPIASSCGNGRPAA
jgi:hypothetical protein